jgi:hypothetical protein
MPIYSGTESRAVDRTAPDTVPTYPRMWVMPAAYSCGRARRLAVRCLLGCTLALAAVRGEAQDAPDYSARASVNEQPETSEQFSEPELHTLQHDLGSAFSIAESLPGIVPVFSGVPYLIIRGATPSGSPTYYDGMEVPTLFHLALGPGIVDPVLQGDLHFYPGPAPARYGARIGGLIEQDGPDPSALRDPQRSLRLSLLDTSGLLNLPTQDGALSISWRYGNAGPMLSALGLNATLSYFDYQLRYEGTLGAHTRFALALLGAGDQLGDRDAPQDDIQLSFHRLLARITEREREFEYGAQLVLGADFSTLGQQLSGHDARATSDLYVQWQHARTRLRTGLKLVSAAVTLTRGPEMQASADASRIDRTPLVPEDFLAGQPYTNVPTRSLFENYAELHLEPWSRWSFDLGLRAELWLAGSKADMAISPGLRVRRRLTDWLDLHAAFSISHKPHTSPLPIPGLDDVSLDPGVETAWQSEAGTSVRLGSFGELDLTLFYHRYVDVVYLELILDCQGNSDPTAAQAILSRGNALNSICRQAGLPTANGEAHGAEVFLRRDFSRRLSGFLSYTLGFASATAQDGTKFTPQSDVRHLINAVLRYEFSHAFTVGLRMQYRTGKMAVNTFLDSAEGRVTRVEYRLPGFLRLDLHASYAWPVSFGRLEASLGIQNATFSREATSRDCLPAAAGPTCQIDYQPYIVLPNIGLRADF